MGKNPMKNPSLDIRKTEFTMLKEQQCSLNMQIRLAMQLHDTQSQTALEKKLNEITKQLNYFI